jgi:hypothetical protein
MLRHPQELGAAFQILCNMLCTVCCSPREQLVAMAVVSVVVVFFLTRSACTRDTHATDSCSLALLAWKKQQENI